MNDVTEKIAELWESILGYTLRKDTKKAIRTILEQVPEFRTYMLSNGTIDSNACEVFITSMFLTYQRAHDRELIANDRSMIQIGTDYIRRNQEELFGIYQTIPQPTLYHAIMTLAVAFGVEKTIPRKDTANISLVQTFCRHAVHLYVHFLQDVLSTLGERLGVINYPIEQI